MRFYQPNMCRLMLHRVLFIIVSSESTIFSFGNILITSPVFTSSLAAYLSP